MKGVLVQQYGPVQALRIADLPDIDVQRGQVRIRVRAAGIGFVDALKIAGQYQTKDPLPFVPAMEFAGIVDVVGGGVSQVKIGDQVFGVARRGALAEQLIVDETELLRTPEHLSFAQAAAVPVNYLTATYALKNRAELQAREKLLVLGAAGGTGTAAIKVGKMLGAQVIAAASTDEKRSFALEQGADATLDYSKEGWREELKSLLDGQSVDVIFDAVGGDISPIAFRTLGWRGRYLVVGFAAGKIPVLPFNIALLKGASLMGVDSAQIQRWEPKVYGRLMSDIRLGLETRSLEPPAVQTFAFDKFKDAFEAISSRRAKGKVVVKMT